MHPYLRFALFLTSTLLIYLGVHYYLASWTSRHLELGITPGNMRLLFWTLAMLTISAMLLNHANPSKTALWIVYCAYLVIGILFLWFSYAFISEVVETALRLLFPKLKPLQFFGWAVLSLTALSAIWAALDARRPPVFKYMEISVKGLPKAYDGFTIVQLSDMHLSHTVNIAQARALFSRLSTLEPDIYAFTGDIIDPGFPEKEEFQALCKSLKSRYGSYGVLGNHEYYYGVGKAVRFYEKSGIHLLRQHNLTLPNGMQITGVDDIREARLTDHDLKTTFSKMQPGKPSIFLAHQPKKLEWAAEHGVTLALAGHTHGGQVFPFNLFVQLAFPKYYYGLHKLKDTWIYITSGTFYWGPPMRFFTKSEVPVIKLRAK
ncbi:MAG TPA: metallophosphoesterase [Elusimicrobiales bacterium]|nr:metallophosphoesterase [Elusimicrobiales bacterium]